jgi:septation ring formation regulator EzrA
MFTDSYEDLKKLSESTLRFLDEREENERIAAKFAEVQKEIGSSSLDVVRTLNSLEKQQDDIAAQIEEMSRRIGEGQRTHELSEHLEEYKELKRMVVELQESEGEWSGPGQEQLINIFENLNQIEVQIREMNEIVDIYLGNC